jgi:hypothetical protein
MTAADGGHPDIRELQAFDRGQLDPAAWDAVERHLAACPACARRLAELPDETVADLLREFDVEPNTPLVPEAGGETVEVPPALRDHPRYRVLGLLGRGGMSVVYRAEHRLMNRTVALKILDPWLTGRGASLERFRREVQAAARLEHPNVVACHDAEQTGDTLFLVMEYVEGETLDAVLRRRTRVDVAEACGWVRQAAVGLHYAHERGLVHRDVKPGNLMLTRQGRVKVLDFGLAQLARADATDPALTPSGVVLGTPAYLAPGQALDPGAADVRADVYALGCTLYHLLTGSPPFAQPTALQQLLAHQDQAPPSLRAARPDVPEALDRLVRSLLAKSPAARPQTAAAVARALEPFAAGAFVPAPNRGRQRWVVAAIGLVVVAALLGLWWQRVGRRDETPGPGPVDPPAARPRIHELAERWLKANDALGPGFPVVADCVRQIEAAEREDKAFVLRLGPGLVKSGKRTLLAGRHHDLGVFELTAEEAGSWPPEHSTLFDALARQGHHYHPETLVELSGLTIEPQGLAPGRNLTGTVAYRRRESLPGEVALVLTYLDGHTTRTLYDIAPRQPAGEQGRLPFSFLPLFAAEPAGPVAAIVEMARYQPGEGKKALVVSNALPVVLLFGQGKVLTPSNF